MHAFGYTVHFQSRDNDKGGGHTDHLTCHSGNHHDARKLRGSMFYRTGVIADPI